MYSLKVLKNLQLADGRTYLVGHDCHALDLFEVSELIHNHPGHFEALDSITTDTIKDAEKMEKFANAKGLNGSLKAVKK